MAPSKLSFFSVSGYTKKKSGAVARALHHEVKRNSLPAVFENVSSTTSERKYMSKKTSFKRIALGVVVALGFGIMSSTPSSAVVSDEVLTLSGTTGLTAVVNESTTAVTATLTFFASATTDSRTLTATAVNSTGSGSATVVFRSTGNDSSNVTVGTNNFKSDTVDTALAVTANAGVKATYSVLAYGFSEVGTYTITVFTRSYTAKTNYADNMGVKAYETQKYASYTVTVTAASTEPTTIKTHTVAAGSEATALYYKNRYAATSDSAVVVDKGTNQSYTAVALIVGNLYASNGETRTGTAKANICATACTVNVTTSLGVIDNGNGAGNSPSTFETMTIGNTTNATIKNETITVYSNGSTGVATISYYLAANNVLLGTSTVTFVGTPASVSQMYSNDTITSTGASTTGTLNAIVKDAAGTTLKSGTVYLYSSDTKVAGSTSASAAYQTCTWSLTGIAACSFAVTETGTATLTLRDSTTVALSTWVSDGWVVTVTGDVANTITAEFDKATYAPGERAILTLTVKDARGVGLATGTTFAFTAVNSLSTITYNTTAGERGTASSLSDAKVFTSYMDTGVETRVITMPTVAGKVEINHKYAKFGVAAGTPDSVALATATVSDPTQTATLAAAEAATDAAAEAIDAANAATDAANLAAEAADAATVAAEEARDAADAATAAVEELATQVATLMAALKAQITTLANTVAKIAKKVAKL